MTVASFAQFVKAYFPTWFTPAPIVTFWIPPRYAFQGWLSWSAKSGIDLGVPGVGLVMVREWVVAS